jgi:hypothetical protein
LIGSHSPPLVVFSGHLETILDEMHVGHEVKKLASDEGRGSEGYTLDVKELIPTKVMREMEEVGISKQEVIQLLREIETGEENGETYWDQVNGLEGNLLEKEKALLEKMADGYTGVQQMKVESGAMQGMGEGQFEHEDGQVMLGEGSGDRTEEMEV